MYDVVVIGGGFAGLTAAVWLGRFRRSTLVISSGPSRNALSRAVHGYPGSEGSNPVELLDKLCREALEYGTEMLTGIAEDVLKTSEGFQILCNNEVYKARRVLLATGTADRKPDIPGFSDFDGISAWHCPACDAYEYIDKRIAVISWGEYMAGYALNFLTYTNSITVLTDGHEPGTAPDHLAKLEQNNIPVLTAKVSAIEGENGQVERLRLQDGSVLECDAVFYNIDHRPRLNLLQRLECELTGDSAVAVNHKQETNIEGVYAAGDIAPLEELVVVAAAMGAVAASNIHKSLTPESQRVE